MYKSQESISPSLPINIASKWSYLHIKALTHASPTGGESTGFQNGTEFTVSIGSWVQYFNWGILGNDERQCVFNCKAWEGSFHFY